MNMNDYDPTVGNVFTPAGIGKYIRFDHSSGMIYVEIDNRYVMQFKASECYID